MDENSLNRVTSRREFLIKSLKTVGYSVPVVMAFSSVALADWTNRYRSHHGPRKPKPPGHRHRPPRNRPRPHRGRR